ncbi:MAG: AMP-binding protein [Nitrospirae bacterium]|nr:AMP-binding protein [Nitrospirota bacterium]
MLVSGKDISVLDALRENYLKRPQHNFIYYRDVAITYENVYRRAQGFAQFLTASGLKRHDRVCLILPRVPELLIAFFSVVMAGGLPVPVNYMMNKGACTDLISSLAPAFIVVKDRLLGILDAETLNKKDTTIVIVGKEQAGLVAFDSVSQPIKTERLLTQHKGVEATGGEILYLNYTTGSTGRPKGAMATHNNIYFNTIAAVEAMKFTSSDVHLCMFASFAHPHELFARALYTGASVVLLEEINPRTIAKTIVERSVTAMMGLAPMYEMLLSHCKGISLNSLRIAESGGMYTPADSIMAFKDTFGIPILSVWGSTETSGVAIANTPERYRMDGSMGMTCPRYNVRCLREDGSEADNGEIGELVFGGPAVAGGFYEDEETDSIESDSGINVFHSGDLGWRDDEGYFYFVERKSGLIKVAGLKVYPLQVELALRQHPGIKEVAVVGVEDKLRGMVPKAFIVLMDGVSLSENDIFSFCKKTMTGKMIPKKIEFISELPKIGSGKVDKKALGVLT